MQYIIVGLCFFGAVAGMIFVKSLDLSAGLTMAIIIPLLGLVVYSMAIIKPPKMGAEKDSHK